MKLFAIIIFISLAGTLAACRSKGNVIQGLITLQDSVTKEEVAASGVSVYMYGSIVQFQDHPGDFSKKAITGTNGYYSLFPLANGPYYIYSQKVDSNGKVLVSAGASTNVAGNETKVLNLFLH